MLLCVGITLAEPTKAEEGWLSREVSRLSGLPHSLSAAQNNAWFQVPVAEQAAHAVPEEAYRAVRPALDAIAAAARPDLERELDEVLRDLTYATLEQTSRQHPLAYASWIGAARPDGMIASASDLQAVMFTRCRELAGAVIARLLHTHVEALDLQLAALPGLDPRFPQWVVGDLAVPDAGGVVALNPARTQAAYQQQVDQRVAAASPGLRREIEHEFTARSWTGGALASPAAACGAMLGPLFAGELATACEDDAARRLLGLLPSMKEAVPTAVRTSLQDKSTLSQADVCRRLRARWLPGDGYPAAIQDGLAKKCSVEADLAIGEAKESL